MSSIQNFTDTVKQLGETLHRRLTSVMMDKAWLRAILDVRYSRDGSSWLSKIRVFVPNGESISVGMTDEVDLILITINTMRSTAFQDTWYGLKLELTPDQECSVRLNYDPAWAEDASLVED
jgi:hypothetical protein